MRTITILIALTMLTTSLAGCTGGDPDGGGNDEFDSEALQDLIDENLQDFMNNTSITVNNHFYNNTTYEIDNTDNSVSNITGSGVGSASTMQMFRVDWDREAEKKLLLSRQSQRAAAIARRKYVMDSQLVCVPGIRLVSLLDFAILTTSKKKHVSVFVGYFRHPPPNWG